MIFDDFPRRTEALRVELTIFGCWFDDEDTIDELLLGLNFGLKVSSSCYFMVILIDAILVLASLGSSSEELESLATSKLVRKIS